MPTRGAFRPFPDRLNRPRIRHGVVIVRRSPGRPLPSRIKGGDIDAPRVDPPEKGVDIPEDTPGLATMAFPCISQTGAADFDAERREAVSSPQRPRRILMNEEGRAMRDRRSVTGPSTRMEERRQSGRGRRPSDRSLRRPISTLPSSGRQINRSSSTKRSPSRRRFQRLSASRHATALISSVWSIRLNGRHRGGATTTAWSHTSPLYDPNRAGF